MPLCKDFVRMKTEHTSTGFCVAMTMHTAMKIHLRRSMIEVGWHRNAASTADEEWKEKKAVI